MLALLDAFRSSFDLRCEGELFADGFGEDVDAEVFASENLADVDVLVRGRGSLRREFERIECALERDECCWRFDDDVDIFGCRLDAVVEKHGAADDVDIDGFL